MSETTSSLSAADLFSVKGLVAVVTGGATGEFAYMPELGDPDFDRLC